MLRSVKAFGMHMFGEPVGRIAMSLLLNALNGFSITMFYSLYLYLLQERLRVRGYLRPAAFSLPAVTIFSSNDTAAGKVEAWTLSHS